MKHAAFLAAAERSSIQIKASEPLAAHTTFRIGGPAELYAAVKEQEQLIALTNLAAKHGVSMTILGGGSNVLISDAGIRGLVSANQTRSITEVTKTPVLAGAPPQIVADSGVALAGLARWAIRAGWSGLEWAVSVPGTVGGAVIGNAGAHGGDVARNLAWALVVYPGHEKQVVAAEDLEYAYRSSTLKRRLSKSWQGMAVDPLPVVLAAGFQLERGDVGEMTARAELFLRQRRANQPAEPSAGSIFRNPVGDHAGRMIEAVGLKGYQIGGARISPRHANFIVNAGGAQAADVVNLIDLIRARVCARFRVDLMPEILFIGAWEKRPPYLPSCRM